jgi:hypothetical protein
MFILLPKGTSMPKCIMTYFVLARVEMAFCVLIQHPQNRSFSQIDEGGRIAFLWPVMHHLNILK